MPKRFNGSHDDIAATLAKHATVPDFISYGETTTYKLNTQKILAVRMMWRELKALHPTLCFSPKDAEAVFGKVAKLANPKWARELSPTELVDYQVKMGKRLRLQARHIKQTEAKHNGKTGWIMQLWGDVKQAKSPSAEEGEEAEEGEGAEEEVPLEVDDPTDEEEECEEE
jgi:hypothetical protein